MSDKLITIGVFILYVVLCYIGSLFIGNMYYNHLEFWLWMVNMFGLLVIFDICRYLLNFIFDD